MRIADVQEHRSFTQRYLRLADDIAHQRHSRLYLGFQIQLFLFDWFANHTTRTDRYLTRFIASQADGTATTDRLSPASADAPQSFF